MIAGDSVSEGEQGHGANEGCMVKVAYRGFFDNGSTFIEQIEQPIEFPCVDGWMPPAFIETVRDMKIGETRTVRIGADEAYEERTESRVMEMERSKMPTGARLVVGEIVSLEQPDGQTFPARVVELTDERVVFDLNHDAVCKALNFELTLLEVYDLPDRRRR